MTDSFGDENRKKISKPLSINRVLHLKPLASGVFHTGHKLCLLRLARRQCTHKGAWVSYSLLCLFLLLFSCFPPVPSLTQCTLSRGEGRGGEEAACELACPPHVSDRSRLGLDRSWPALSYLERNGEQGRSIPGIHLARLLSTLAQWLFLSDSILEKFLSFLPLDLSMNSQT